jgi:single-strand DNA-binding protein
MAGETTLTVVGNLTSDPEIRYTQSGAAVCSFTVASTPRTYDAQSGQWKDGDALFMRVNTWRTLAENCSESLRRGNRVIASGRLRQRSFETKEGEKRTVVELEADDIGPSLKFAQATVRKVDRDGGNQQPRQQSGHAPADDPWGSAPPASGRYNDEPPF